MRLHVLAPVVITTALISACGGGGSSSDTPTSGGTTPTSPTNPTPPTTPAATTTVSGVATKGPLKRALVTAYKVTDSGARGEVITSKETDDSGGYTLDLGSYTGPVQLEVTVVAGKTTTADESTGIDQTLPADFKLRSTLVVAAPASGNTQIQSASITPFTELATKIADDSGGQTKANIENAGKVVFDLIGLNPVTTKPIDYSKAAPDGATEEQKKYALLNAAISTLAATAPTTTDTTTLACFASAGSDSGKRIKCATDQIAKAVTVDKSGGSATAAVNKNFVGLGDALMAASNDDKNKTGKKVRSDDADNKRLKELETEVKNSSTGTAPPVKLEVPVQDQADVAKAKLFFNRLRSNVASLQTAPLDTGLTDGLRAFETSLNTEALAVTSQTGQLIRLATVGLELWSDYKSGLTTNASRGIAGLSQATCTVFSGSFPTQFGGDDKQVGSDGQPGASYGGGSAAATSKEEAAWVGCAVNQGSTPSANNPTVVQYRRTILLNTSASTFPGNIPYIANTRSRFYDGTNVVQRNLTPTLSGMAGYTVTNGSTTGMQLVGDLPPGVSSTGSLQAARFAANVAANISTLTSGATKVALTSGSFAVVPVGASSASLTLDLSADGVTAVVIPNTDPALSPTAQQLADASITVAATVSTAKGALAGKLVADRFAVDTLGSLQPNHLTFTGRISAAGSNGTVGEVLVGTLEGTRTDTTKTVGFSGTLSLPSRPVVSLSVSLTETAATASAAANTALTARYAQDAITMQITGSKTGDNQSMSLADSSGVSVSLQSGNNSAELTVSGRNAGTIDNRRGRITYVDGTFESLN